MIFNILNISLYRIKQQTKSIIKNQKKTKMALLANQTAEQNVLELIERKGFNYKFFRNQARKTAQCPHIGKVVFLDTDEAVLEELQEILEEAGIEWEGVDAADWN